MLRFAWSGTPGTIAFGSAKYGSAVSFGLGLIGFHPPVPGGAAEQVEHQFLNTGLAVHAVVIRRFLDAEGIEYHGEG